METWGWVTCVSILNNSQLCGIFINFMIKSDNKNKYKSGSCFIFRHSAWCLCEICSESLTLVDKGATIIKRAVY